MIRQKKKLFILLKIKFKKGFTLLEMLLSLFVISLFLLSTNQLIGYQQRLQNSFEFKSEQEWHLALAQIEHRLKNYYCMNVYPRGVDFNPLHPEIDGIGYITLKRGLSGTHLYFDKNGGNEPIMTNVRSVQFKKEGFGKLKMTVTFYSGEVKNAYLLLYDQKS